MCLTNLYYKYLVPLKKNCFTYPERCYFFNTSINHCSYYTTRSLEPFTLFFCTKTHILRNEFNDTFKHLYASYLETSFGPSLLNDEQSSCRPNHLPFRQKDEVSVESETPSEKGVGEVTSLPHRRV